MVQEGKPYALPLSSNLEQPDITPFTAKLDKELKKFEEHLWDVLMLRKALSVLNHYAWKTNYAHQGVDCKAVVHELAFAQLRGEDLTVEELLKRTAQSTFCGG